MDSGPQHTRSTCDTCVVVQGLALYAPAATCRTSRLSLTPPALGVVIARPGSYLIFSNEVLKLRLLFLENLGLVDSDEWAIMNGGK